MSADRGGVSRDEVFRKIHDSNLSGAIQGNCDVAPKVSPKSVLVN